jgi:hypothetical protein
MRYITPDTESQNFYWGEDLVWLSSDDGQSATVWLKETRGYHRSDLLGGGITETFPVCDQINAARRRILKSHLWSTE